MRLSLFVNFYFTCAFYFKLICNIIKKYMNTFVQLLSELNQSQYKAATFEKKHCMVLEKRNHL